MHAPIRVINWWFWQEADKPLAVNLDRLEVIEHAGFTTLDGEYTCSREAALSLMQAVKDYVLWRAVEQAKPTPPLVPSSPPPSPCFPPRQ